MREALIVWGGWSGHEPEKGAHIVAGLLEPEGFKVYVENTTEAFADPAIADMSLIVPIVTMSKIEKEEVENLTAAVRGGVGLAGYHGGMCDSFRESVDYQFMCGGQWVAHPGSVIDYRVDIAKPDDPIMHGHSQLPVPLRAILHARRSVERSARHHDFFRRARAVDQGRRDARRMEAQAWAGPRLLQLARPRLGGVRRAGDAGDPAARDAVGGALISATEEGPRRSRRMTPMQTDAAFTGLQTAETLTPSQIEERALALRDQLSLDEKISLMHGQLPLWPGLAAMTAPGGYSSRLWGAGEVTRLGIPGIRFTDGPRGVILEGATTFPVSMARGAAFDPALEERVGEAIGREVRALGAITSAASASTCCATRHGVAPRKPMAKIRIISAPWAPL